MAVGKTLTTSGYLTIIGSTTVVIRKDNEMKNTLKAGLIAVLVFAFTNVAVRYIVDANRTNNKLTTIDSITKQEYLDAVRQKGGGEYEVCIYDKVIDKIGVKATYKLDAQVSVDKANADKYITPELTEVMGQCASEKL